MTLFWILVAVMMAVALGFFAPALLRSSVGLDVRDRDRQNVVIARERLAELEAELKEGTLDQAGFEQAKGELEQALLIDLEDAPAEPAGPTGDKFGGKAAMVGLAVFVPVATLSIYLSLGSPELVNGPVASSQVASHGTGSDQMPSLEQMVGALRTRLEQAPDDAEGWYLLGRTYMAIEDYPNAVTAYARLYQLVGDEPRVMLSLADAEAMSQAGSMAGRPAELVRKAVQIVPNDTTALWLAGIAEDQEGNHREAIAYWNRLRPLLQEDAASLQRVENLIAQAMEKGNIDVGAVAAPEPVAADGAKRIRVRVALDPALQEGTTPDQVVFVFARALSGPRMPLAAARHKVSDLPLELTLDDSSAMTPQMKLSNFDQVLVGARISKSGNPIAATGDLTGDVSPVQTGADGLVEVVIDSRVP